MEIIFNLYICVDKRKSLINIIFIFNVEVEVEVNLILNSAL